MTRSFLTALFATGLLPCFGNEEVSFGDQLGKLPPEITRALAERQIPDELGAMGRNRNAYFHVRFQMGVHRLADHALAGKDPDALELFVRAIEYAFEHQKEDGRFEVAVPKTLVMKGQPSATDLASGVAFFLASAGTGMVAIRSSTWVQETPGLQPLRDRCTKIAKRLRPTLDALLEDEPLLLAADRQAPNRLLFDSAAFFSLGKLLDAPEALAAGERFLALAEALIHEEGYFIEGGGTDTSYNGVAAAIALRMALMIESEPLKTRALKAAEWQITRISAEGEISTDGNTRVRPGGESFLDREKDIDVAHTLEALALTSMITQDEATAELANRVYRFYRKR